MMLDYFYGQSGELFSYFRIPKALFQDHRFRQLSTDARTLYGILLDRMSLSAKNGWLDEQGRVYIVYTVREVQESLCCAEHKAVKLFRELEDIDLIERKRRGLGRPSLVYVKDFSSGLPKAQVQNCPNSNSGAAESAILEQPKPQANKTDKNKTEWNDPDPIYSGGIRDKKLLCIMLNCCFPNAERRDVSQCRRWNARKSPKAHRSSMTLLHCSGMQIVCWDLRHSRPWIMPKAFTKNGSCRQSGSSAGTLYAGRHRQPDGSHCSLCPYHHFG